MKPILTVLLLDPLAALSPANLQTGEIRHSRRRLAALLLSSVIGLLPLAAQSNSTSKLTSEFNAPAEFRIASGDYSITIQKTPAWTFRSVDYQGKPVMIPSGWMQPVLNVQENGKSDFIGTGHGREVVSSLELFTDGRPVSLKSDQKEYRSAAGSKMRLIKRSIMGPFAHRSVLDLSSTGFDQHYYFEVKGDTSQVNWLYAFMLIFPNDAQDYRLALSDGKILEGHLPGATKNEYSLFQDKVAHLSMFNAATGLAVTFVSAIPYPSRDQKGNFFVDRPRDNKFYLQVVPALQLGEKSEYHMKMRCAEATKESFAAVSDDLARAVKVDFQKAKSATTLPSRQ